MGRVWAKYCCGALDIICVEQPDGTFKSSGWYLHFSWSCFVKKTSVVKIVINNKEVNSRITYGQFGIDKNGVPTYPRHFDELGPIIAKLPEGKNDIVFSIKGREDLKPVEAHIFRWKWDSQIVVVDVDGTMTKSEVRGLIYCFVNVNYLHEGVASMFSKIESSGYQLIYLTARPICWIKNTRCYISYHGDKTNPRTKLPQGPVITSCHGVLRIASRYLKGLSRAAFKTSCLRKIQGLFPENTIQPFAGFGDKNSDIKSYKAVGISKENIYHMKNRTFFKGTGEEFISFNRGKKARRKKARRKKACGRIVPDTKLSGNDRVNEDEGILSEEDLEAIRTSFPPVRKSDSHRGERDVGGNGRMKRTSASASYAD